MIKAIKAVSNSLTNFCEGTDHYIQAYAKGGQLVCAEMDKLIVEAEQVLAATEASPQPVKAA